MQLGDTIKLIRRITDEPLEMELVGVLAKAPTPAVEVAWLKDRRYRYKLDLTKNEVLALDATPAHRQSMRAWYRLSEEDRHKLTELFWTERKKARR